jgi:hypothetical protein
MGTVSYEDAYTHQRALFTQVLKTVEQNDV